MPSAQVETEVRATAQSKPGISQAIAVPPSGQTERGDHNSNTVFSLANWPTDRRPALPRAPGGGVAKQFIHAIRWSTAQAERCTSLLR